MCRTGTWYCTWLKHVQLIYCPNMISLHVYLLIYITSNLCRFVPRTAPCHTAAVPSSRAPSCPWWKQNRCHTRLRQGPLTTTEGLCRGTYGTWSACTFLDREGMPVTPRQHRGATPVSSSTTSLELSRSHTSRTESGSCGGGGRTEGEKQKCPWCTGQELESKRPRMKNVKGETFFPCNE